jgi:hypothetical protein
MGMISREFHRMLSPTKAMALFFVLLLAISAGCGVKGDPIPYTSVYPDKAPSVPDEKAHPPTNPAETPK